MDIVPIEMFLVKLGGSMITYKGDIGCGPYRWKEMDLHYRVRKDRIILAAGVLKDQLEHGLILIHGGGTHGHRTVKRWRDGITKGSSEMMAWEVKWRMQQLSTEVIGILGRFNVPAIEVAPSDIAMMDGGRIESIDINPLEKIIERGGVPVLRGDLAPDLDGGWSIISGDEIILELSKRFGKGGIEKVIMCMEEEGVFEGYGTEKQRLIGCFDERNDRSLGDPISVPTDETGGLLEKIRICRSIAGSGVPSQIIGGNIGINLEKAFRGQKVGTLFPVKMGT